MLQPAYIHLYGRPGDDSTDVYAHHRYFLGCELQGFTIRESDDDNV